MKTHNIKAELPDLPKAGDGMKWAEVEYRMPDVDDYYLDYRDEWRGSSSSFDAKYLTTHQIPMTHQEVFEAQGYEVGDTVRVTRKAKSDENGWENGWENSWVGSMNILIGREVKILRVSESLGYLLDMGVHSAHTPLWFPSFVCERVELEIDPNDDVIRVGDTVEMLSGKFTGINKGDRNKVSSMEYDWLNFLDVDSSYSKAHFRKITPAYELEKLENKRLNLIDKCKKTEGKLSAINSRINILRKAQS